MLSVTQGFFSKIKPPTYGAAQNTIPDTIDITPFLKESQRIKYIVSLKLLQCDNLHFEYTLDLNGFTLSSVQRAPCYLDKVNRLVYVNPEITKSEVESFAKGLLLNAIRTEVAIMYKNQCIELIEEYNKQIDNFLKSGLTAEQFILAHDFKIDKGNTWSLPAPVIELKPSEEELAREKEVMEAELERKRRLEEGLKLQQERLKESALKMNQAKMPKQQKASASTAAAVAKGSAELKKATLEVLVEASSTAQVTKVSPSKTEVASVIPAAEKLVPEAVVAPLHSYAASSPATDLGPDSTVSHYYSTGAGLSSSTAAVVHNIAIEQQPELAAVDATPQSTVVSAGSEPLATVQQQPQQMTQQMPQQQPPPMQYVVPAASQFSLMGLPTSLQAVQMGTSGPAGPISISPLPPGRFVPFPPAGSFPMQVPPFGFAQPSSFGGNTSRPPQLPPRVMPVYPQPIHRFHSIDASTEDWTTVANAMQASTETHINLTDNAAYSGRFGEHLGYLWLARTLSVRNDVRVIWRNANGEQQNPFDIEIVTVEGKLLRRVEVKTRVQLNPEVPLSQWLISLPEIEEAKRCHSEGIPYVCVLVSLRVGTRQATMIPLGLDEGLVTALRAKNVNLLLQVN
jgi:hypothetical protein